MRIRKIVVGLSAVLAVASIAACSSGNDRSSAAQQVNVAADMAGQTTAPATTTTTVAPSTTTQQPTTTVPTTTTTTKPPAVTHQVTAPQDVSTAIAGVPCKATVSMSACADLSAHKAWLISNGQVVYGPVSIMPGRKGWPTPVGTFHVEAKVAHYFSREFQAPMPNSVFFQPGVAFHLGSLSVPSHGCVHLSAAASLKFFDTLQVGDVVQVVS